MGTLFLTKKPRTCNGAKTASSINGTGKNWTAACKRMRLEHFLTSYTKINTKWIKDLNVRPETLKPLEENIGRTHSDINHSKILYNTPARLKEIKRKINKRDLINLFFVLFYQIYFTYTQMIQTCYIQTIQTSKK